MPICIECRYAINQLYTSYSKADDRALGKGVRLTQCPRCKRFADKYVEHDFVVLFIDLVLIKPQVYRHLLFNRLHREDGKLDPSIIRLSVLLLLFDVYLTWARIEKATTLGEPGAGLLSNRTLDKSSTNMSNSSSAYDAGLKQPRTDALGAQPIFVQYLFYLTLCALETIAFHLPLRLLCSLPPSPPPSPASHSSPLPQNIFGPLRNLIPYYPHPTLLSTALTVSSFTKLFPLLLLIWNYDLPSSASAVSWAVIINNIAALEILLDCGYLRASFLAGIGAVFRAFMGWIVLMSAGVSRGTAVQGVVETGDVVGWIKGLGII